MNRGIHFAQLCVWSLAIAVALGALTRAENWPRWRGPNDAGAATEGRYPSDFGHDHGLAWKVELPGPGCSTPAVWDNAIFVTCSIDAQDGVVCYDAAGNEVWRQALGPAREAKNRVASGSNPSPATDGEHVVVYFKSGTLACLTLDGNLQWRTNLQEKYGPDTLWWDIGTSPVLAGDRVIAAVMQAGDSYLVAFDLAKGTELWKQPRKYVCPRESDQAYTTPHVAQVDGQSELVVWGADHLTGHDLATGKLLWECGGFNPANSGGWRAIACPVIDGGMAMVPFGRGDFLAGIKLGGNGDITSTARAWETSGRRIGSDVPTPAVRSGLVYVLGDGGHVSCVSLQSGDEIWSGDLPRNRKRYYSSPLVAGNKLYAAREDGMVFVVDITNGFNLVAENDMSEPIIAAPVPVDNGLLLRGREHLFRVE
jgi:outer membrane protein assembly factor BamB